jgi:hypothetical protein
MNNLILAFFVFASAGIVWLSQRSAMETARPTNHTLTTELVRARALLLETAIAATNAQQALAARRDELIAVRNEAAKPLESVQPTSVPPLDPAHEGMWPTNKPYCYLAKKHLETIGFVPFDQEERLTSEAATLLGMSPAEKNAADSAYQHFLERTRQLHLAQAQPIMPAPGINTADHREITYRIPVLTNEFHDVRRILADELRQALGASRAELFLKRADSELDEAYGQYGGNSGYTIKFHADRQADATVQHELTIQRADGRASNGYRVSFPLEPLSGMWKYRHLFGEEPLLQASPKD